jgi:hypothetical protein
LFLALLEACFRLETGLIQDCYTESDHVFTHARKNDVPRRIPHRSITHALVNHRMTHARYARIFVGFGNIEPTIAASGRQKCLENDSNLASPDEVVQGLNQL